MCLLWSDLFVEDSSYLILPIGFKDVVLRSGFPCLSRISKTMEYDALLLAILSSDHGLCDSVASMVIL